MDTSNIDSSLKAHGIRSTQIRRSVLDVFYRRSFALSQAEIAMELTEAFDRVTIYRTLNKFVKRGLIHKVVDESNITKYALCDDNHCDIEIHRDDHVHFKCRICGHTFCLNSVEVSLPSLPPGYQTNLLMITAKGICKDCATTE
jgi:Fur family transcriptional regulator, ferric uptake regulator